MKVQKMTISLEAQLGEGVRQAARRAGKPVSSWLAEAAASKLRSEALARFLDEWEHEHGPPSAAQLARAEAELGLRSDPAGA